MWTKSGHQPIKKSRRRRYQSLCNLSTKDGEGGAVAYKMQIKKARLKYRGKNKWNNENWVNNYISRKTNISPLWASPRHRSTKNETQQTTSKWKHRQKAWWDIQRCQRWMEITSKIVNQKGAACYSFFFGWKDAANLMHDDKNLQNEMLKTKLKTNNNKSKVSYAVVAQFSVISLGMFFFFVLFATDFCKSHAKQQESCYPELRRKATELTEWLAGCLCKPNCIRQQTKLAG